MGSCDNSGHLCKSPVNTGDCPWTPKLPPGWGTLMHFAPHCSKHEGGHRTFLSLGESWLERDGHERRTSPGKGRTGCGEPLGELHHYKYSKASSLQPSPAWCRAGNLIGASPVLQKCHTSPHSLQRIPEGVSRHPRLEPQTTSAKATAGQRSAPSRWTPGNKPWYPVSHEEERNRWPMSTLREKVRSCSSVLGHRLKSPVSVLRTSFTLPRQAEHLQQAGWWLNWDWR